MVTLALKLSLWILCPQESLLCISSSPRLQFDVAFAFQTMDRWGVEVGVEQGSVCSSVCVGLQRLVRRQEQGFHHGTRIEVRKRELRVHGGLNASNICA